MNQELVIFGISFGGGLKSVGLMIAGTGRAGQAAATAGLVACLMACALFQSGRQCLLIAWRGCLNSGRYLRLMARMTLTAPSLGTDATTRFASTRPILSLGLRPTMSVTCGSASAHQYQRCLVQITRTQNSKTAGFLISFERQLSRRETLLTHFAAQNLSSTKYALAQLIRGSAWTH